MVILGIKNQNIVLLQSTASSWHQGALCVVFTSGCRQETVTTKAFHQASCVEGTSPYGDKQIRTDQTGTQRLSSTDHTLFLTQQLCEKCFSKLHGICFKGRSKWTLRLIIFTVAFLSFIYTDEIIVLKTVTGKLLRGCWVFDFIKKQNRPQYN